jgi:hypothetical protein
MLGNRFAQVCGEIDVRIDRHVRSEIRAQRETCAPTVAATPAGGARGDSVERLAIRMPVEKYGLAVDALTTDSESALQQWGRDRGPRDLRPVVDVHGALDPTPSQAIGDGPEYRLEVVALRHRYEDPLGDPHPIPLAGERPLLAALQRRLVRGCELSDALGDGAEREIRIAERR